MINAYGISGFYFLPFFFFPGHLFPLLLHHIIG